MSQYYSHGSIQNVLSHLRQLSIFCVAFCEPFLPVSRNALLGFIELMSRTSSHDHIQHVLASISFLHKCKGAEYPGDSFEFHVLLRGLKRKLARPKKQALPITPEILILMYQYVDIKNQSSLAHWPAFLFALRLLYRKSSVAPKSWTAFNSARDFSREKAVITGNVILVYQNHSKTDQFMANTRVIPLLASSIRALDPVFHYSELVKKNLVPGNYPAFTFIESGKLRCVTYSSFTSYLKLLLRQIGLDPDRWTGHSFRRGGASLLYRLGLDPVTIQACGDWKTDTFLKYLEVNFDRLWFAQRTMAGFSCS